MRQTAETETQRKSFNMRFEQTPRVVLKGRCWSFLHLDMHLALQLTGKPCTRLCQTAARIGTSNLVIPKGNRRIYKNGSIKICPWEFETQAVKTTGWSWYCVSHGEGGGHVEPVLVCAFETGAENREIIFRPSIRAITSLLNPASQMDKNKNNPYRSNRPPLSAWRQTVLHTSTFKECRRVKRLRNEMNCQNEISPLSNMTSEDLSS